MPHINFFQQMLVWFLIPSTVIVQTFGFKFLPVLSSSQKVIPKLNTSVQGFPSHASVEVDLSNAEKILDTYRSFPPCSRTATQILLDALKSTGELQYEELRLEQLRKWYAIQMAGCELPKAIPAECLNLNLPGTTNTEIGTSSPVQSTLDLCIHSLFKSPQVWTSFSNNHQNAIVLSHVFRDDVDRQHQVDIFKAFFSIINRTSSSFQSLIERVHSLRQEMSDLSDEFRARQEAQMEHLNTSVTDTLSQVDDMKSSVNSLTQKFSLQVINMMGVVSRFTAGVHESFASLSNTATQVTLSVTQLNTTINDMQDHQLLRALEQEQLTDKIVGDLNTISAHTSKLDQLFHTLQALAFLSPYFLVFLIIRQVTCQHPRAGAWMMILLAAVFLAHGAYRAFPLGCGCEAVACAGLGEV